MKQWEPSDWIAFGLLGFIWVYLLLVFVLRMKGYSIDEGEDVRTKEIVIYILGILSGYIGIKKVQKKNGN
jgi:hypothetical protein